ncbi:helix-turn-helix domain-containing protein [Brevibacterium sp. JNUCC-42]|nr:helix-turn-helix domain-containing protein [Brevibacterium sp. JNUCC-42]
MFRQKKGLSQYDLADDAELSRGFIYEVETGTNNISMLVLERIAFTLGVSLTQLFDDSTEHRTDVKRMKNVRECIGHNVRQFRLKNNISQQELGDKTDLGRTYINNLENGKRNITVMTLAKVSSAFDIHISKLLEDNGNEEKMD